MSEPIVDLTREQEQEVLDRVRMGDVQLSPRQKLCSKM
jgi:hypothetical protein